MKTGNFSTKLNNIPFGMLVGLLVAVLASYIIYSVKHPVSFLMFENRYAITLYLPYLQMGAFANLAPFFLFNHYEMMNAQKGVIASTIIIFLFVVAIGYIL